MSEAGCARVRVCLSRASGEEGEMGSQEKNQRKKTKEKNWMGQKQSYY